MGFPQHTRLVIACDGAEVPPGRLAPLLWDAPAPGVTRHADAGYEDAIAFAREHGLRLPGILG